MQSFEVPPERLARWLQRWAGEHDGIAAARAETGAVRFTGGDGAGLEAEVPLPPFEGEPSIEGLVAHAARERRVGVLLVRLGGYAAGVFEGDRLVQSKVDSRLVHGRHKKGGSSARRFERRRGEQARAALDAAADTAARVLGGVPLDAVVLGGDRRAVDLLRDDPRLAPLFALATARFLGDVPDPRRAVLEATPKRFLATVLRPSG